MKMECLMLEPGEDKRVSDAVIEVSRRKFPKEHRKYGLVANVTFGDPDENDNHSLLIAVGVERDDVFEQLNKVNHDRYYLSLGKLEELFSMYEEERKLHRDIKRLGRNGLRGSFIWGNRIINYPLSFR